MIALASHLSPRIAHDLALGYYLGLLLVLVLVTLPGIGRGGDR